MGIQLEQYEKNIKEGPFPPLRSSTARNTNDTHLRRSRPLSVRPAPSRTEKDAAARSRQRRSSCGGTQPKPPRHSSSPPRSSDGHRAAAAPALPLPPYSVPRIFDQSGMFTGSDAAATCSATTAQPQRREPAKDRGVGGRDSRGGDQVPPPVVIAGHVPAGNAAAASSSASGDGAAEQEEAERERGRRQGPRLRHCYVLPEEAQEHWHQEQEEASPQPPPPPSPLRWPLLVAVVRRLGEP